MAGGADPIAGRSGPATSRWEGLAVHRGPGLSTLGTLLRAFGSAASARFRPDHLLGRTGAHHSGSSTPYSLYMGASDVRHLRNVL